MTDDELDRVVGADRVLAVLVELARRPDGVGLDELAASMRSSKSTVHRALSALRRAGLAAQPARGVYVLGDEFLRLAFVHNAGRPESVRVEPVLRALSRRFGETTHYAVLDGHEVVYRAKVDPPEGGVRLSSVVGGRNPAHSTAVGKALLANVVASEADLVAWLGARKLEARTENTLTTVPALWADLAQTRSRGYAIDDQENELGINCIGFAVRHDPGVPSLGAVSISAVAFRTPIGRLLASLDEIREVIVGGAPVAY